MAGWFEKLRTRLGSSDAPPRDPSSGEATEPDRPEAEAISEAATVAGGTGVESPGGESARPEVQTSVPVMVEILKLLSRIEYGLDVEQIANSLAISPEDARANCDALEQEMFVHHHESAAEWFIGQRGLEFLRLNGDAEAANPN